MPPEPTASSQLTPELTTALENTILAKCQSASAKQTDQILEGAKVAFDVRVDIKGILTRGEGYASKPTTNLLSKAVLARLLRNLGATKASAKKALLAAATEALQLNEDGQKNASTSDNLVEADRELLMAIDEVDQDILAKLPKTRRAGPIKVAATVNFLKSKLEPQNL